MQQNNLNINVLRFSITCCFFTMEKKGKKKKEGNVMINQKTVHWQLVSAPTYELNQRH